MFPTNDPVPELYEVTVPFIILDPLAITKDCPAEYARSVATVRL